MARTSRATGQEVGRWISRAAICSCPRIRRWPVLCAPQLPPGLTRTNQRLKATRLRFLTITYKYYKLSQAIKPFQCFGLVMVADFFQRLGFNLADTLAGDPGDLAHLLQSMAHPVFQTETHF